VIGIILHNLQIAERYGSVMYDSRIEKILFTKEQIEKKCRELGEKISEEYMGKQPLLICLLRGALPFYAELIKNITIDMEMDFMYVSSYQGAKSTGNLNIRLDLGTNIEGRNVIIIDDIIDTGVTMTKIRDELVARGAASVKICTFLNKPNRAEGITIEPDYYGYDIPKKYVVGFGMDYNHIMRNLPYIGVLKQSIYQQD